MHLFVARFSDILTVSITCNGCDVTLSGRRYRCLDCLDVDLCNDCYTSEYEIVSNSTLIDHFTVLCSVTWPLNSSEAGGDLVLIQTSLLLLCKSSCSNAN